MEGADEDAVAGARAGDAEAYRRLVERHSRAVFRLAFRMTGNEQDAEDVVQETFLKAYKRLAQFEDRANFGTWLHRIAANSAFDLLRSRLRRGEEPLADEAQAGPPPLPDESPAPDRQAFGAEIGRRLRVAMARLSPTERTAFVLRHHEGMSIEEIGAELGLGESATKHSVFRAVKKLREALEPLRGAAS